MYANENTDAKLRVNVLNAIANLAGKMCVSKVVELDLNSCGNFDCHLSNNAVFLCLYDFERIVSRGKADVPQSDIERIGAPVKVVRICVDLRLDFRNLSG